MVRQPAVENRFYPGNKNQLYQSFHKFESQARFTMPEKTSDVIGAILPHAGHLYSGCQTVPFFKYLKNKAIQPDTFIIFHPNHTGAGNFISIDGHDTWSNALGEIEIDIELAQALPFIKDTITQQNEHSAEVLIPFIQYYYRDHLPEILPICLHYQKESDAQMIAGELYQAVRNTGKKIIVLASSDFSHFLSPEKGYEMDQLVLDQIAIRDYNGVCDVVQKHHISVCGFFPIMILMAYAEHVSANYSTHILARGHSGQVHPSNEVVDYISVIFQI